MHSGSYLKQDLNQSVFKRRSNFNFKSNNKFWSFFALQTNISQVLSIFSDTKQSSSLPLSLIFTRFCLFLHTPIIKTIDFFFHLYYTDNASQTCGFSCVCSMTDLILKLLHNYCRETFNVKSQGSVGTKTFATINTRERLFTIHVPMKESVYSLSPNHAKYH